MARAESKKRTKLARERTKLAYDRTIMAYIRTSTTVTLFGIAFLGFSEIKWDFFFTTGFIAIIAGVSFLIAALLKGTKYRKEFKF